MTTLWLWALRDVLRRPGEALLVAAALFALAGVLGTDLLLSASLRSTAERLVDAGPSLVVRRLDAGGWAPMPETEAVTAARSVRGVTDARTRIWGVVAGPDGPVTLVGLGPADAERIGVAPPGPGEAIVGRGVADALGDTVTVLDLPRIDGRSGSTFEVRRVLDPTVAGAALHRAVLTDRDTARALLLLPPGHASDLAIEVRHAAEQLAILPDLTAALPWPVRAVTQDEALGRYATNTARRGSLGALVTLPALLAIFVLVIGVARDRVGRRSEVALLKAMGWTTSDVVQLHLARAAWIGLPAVVLGTGAAWLAVLWPGVRWPAALFLDWPGSPPPLTLDPDGALLVIAEVLGLVGAPWLLAVLWPAFRAAVHDPGEMLAEDAPA